MNRGLITAMAVLAIGSISGSKLAAQGWEAGLPGDDVFSVGIQVGAVSPSTTLPDGGGFENGFAGAVSATYWTGPHVGLRANLAIGSTSGDETPGSLAAAEDPSVMFYGGELVARYPVGTSSLVVSPYAGLGGGVKLYDWEGWRTGLDKDLTFAWNLSGGLDIRPVSTPWIGFIVEAKRFTSKYKWHALNFEEPTVNDYLFSVGVSLNR